jgi:hypothetical protein
MIKSRSSDPQNRVLKVLKGLYRIRESIDKL